MIHRLPEIFENVDSHICKNNTFQKCSRDFLDCVRYPGVFKDENSWLWCGGLDTSKNPKIMKIRVSGLWSNEIGILFYQNEAEKINKAIKSIIKMHVPNIWPTIFFPMLLLLRNDVAWKLLWNSPDWTTSWSFWNSRKLGHAEGITASRIMGKS